MGKDAKARGFQRIRVLLPMLPLSRVNFSRPARRRPQGLASSTGTVH